MKVLHNFRFLIFILPGVFFVLSFVYQDSSYLLLAGVSLLISVFVAFPKILSHKYLSLPHMHVPVFPKKSESKVKMKPRKVATYQDKSIVFALVTIGLFTILFSFLAVYMLRPVSSVHNIVLEYYISQVFAFKQTGIFIIALAIFLLGGYLFFQLKRRHIDRNFVIRKILVGFAGVLFSFVISFIIIYALAIVQLNSAVIVIKFSPNAVGVLYKREAIVAKIKSLSSVPEIIGSENNISNLMLSSIVNKNAKQDSYYQTRIMKTMPHFLVLPFNLTKNQNIVMVNNTVLMTSLDKGFMQSISPTLSRTLLKNYFKNRNLKDDPTIAVLNRQEYLAFRQTEINHQEDQMQTRIQKQKDYLYSLQSDASSTQQKITDDQGIMDRAVAEENTIYDQCKKYGYPDPNSGQFVPYYPDSYCSSLKDQLIQAVSQGNQTISQLKGNLQYDYGQISQAQSTLATLQSYIQSLEDQKSSTPDELGLFEAPSTIRIIVDSTNPNGINDFLETNVHESLHYQSYVSQERQFQFSDGSYDGFWEEGLTEYFARKVVKADLGVSINQGYPLLVKVVAQIAKKIPESELQKIYFTKNEGLLEADLNAAYGTTFYKDSELYFETLSYLPDNQQVKIANNIMTRIGGQQLTTNDLYSTDLQQE